MRRRLVEMREEKGLSREKLAELLDCNVRTVTRWETGERRPQVAQKAALARVLDRTMTDLDLALSDDRASVLGLPVPATLTMFATLEAAATELRTWEPLAVPGLLQTAAYAEAVERVSIHTRSEAEIARRVRFRLARQDAIMWDKDPLHLHALLDESVLIRVTGDPVIMARQIGHLREMSRRPNVDIRVTPLDGRVHAAPPGAFRLLSGEARMPYLACTEELSGVQYRETPSLVDGYVTLFERLWSDGRELDEIELLER
jgi:transcriptional regulator with XRE-family HTH domain